MAEIYTIHLRNDSLEFIPREGKLPDVVLSPQFNPKADDAGIEVICRMGDPDLANCVVYKNKDNSGGIFSLYDRDGLLFVAVAENNLIYAIAQGYFGQLTANARYGVDIFEEMEVPDD